MARLPKPIGLTANSVSSASVGTARHTLERTTIDAAAATGVPERDAERQRDHQRGEDGDGGDGQVLGEQVEDAVAGASSSNGSLR